MTSNIKQKISFCTPIESMFILIIVIYACICVISMNAMSMPVTWITAERIRRFAKQSSNVAQPTRYATHGSQHEPYELICRTSIDSSHWSNDSFCSHATRISLTSNYSATHRNSQGRSSSISSHQRLRESFDSTHSTSRRMTGFLRKFGKGIRKSGNAVEDSNHSNNFNNNNDNSNKRNMRGEGRNTDASAPVQRGNYSSTVSDTEGLSGSPNVIAEPPQRKRKSADKMSIIISCPPWKSPTVGDQFPNFHGKFTTPLDLEDQAPGAEDMDRYIEESQSLDNSDIEITQRFLAQPPAINYYDYQGDQWGIIFMLPSYDVSSVSISELVVLMSPEMQTELARRNVKVCCFTVNPCKTNRSWIVQALTDYANSGRVGNAKAHFPIFCDNSTFDNAVELGSLDEDQTSDCGVPILYRTTFFIRPDKTIAMTMQQTGNIGRDFVSILRQLDQLQDRGNHRPSSSEDENVNANPTHLIMSKMIDQLTVNDDPNARPEF